MATSTARWAQHAIPDEDEARRARIKALEEILAFASHVPNAYIAHVDGGRQSALLLTPALMLRRLVEALAAVRELVAVKLPGSVPVHLRTMQEVELGLTHLLAGDFLHRSASYIVGREYETVRQLRLFEHELGQLDDEDAEGRAMLAELVGSDPRPLEEAVAAAEERLTHPALAEAVAEYEAARPRHWYSLFGGPNNLRDLAAMHGELSLYLATYKLWSRHVHGTELLQGNIEIEGGTAKLFPLHSDREINQYTAYAISFTLRGMRRVTRTRMDEKHFQHLRRWYRQEFKPLFDHVLRR